MRRYWTFLILAVLAVTALLASVLSVATRSDGRCAIDKLDTPALAAHRGGADIHPENTLAAFEHIVEDYPDMVLEMDVRALSDGTLVVHHDDTTDRTWGASGRLSDMTEADWRDGRVQHPTGGPSAPASTLDDILDRFGGTDAMLLIELKSHTARSDFIEALWPHRGQVMVASFSYEVSSIFVRSGFSTMQLSSNHPTSIVDGVQALGIRSDSITDRTIEAANDAHTSVWAWGDQVTPARSDLTEMGVAGLIVDDPTF